MLDLAIKCVGSPPFRYCTRTMSGAYNITGNETCEVTEISQDCNIPFTRFILDLEPRTILLIIENDVTIQRKTVAINIYDVKKQSQLSVFVVPVIFILASIISVIFGVAKYVQTRNR